MNETNSTANLISNAYVITGCLSLVFSFFFFLKRQQTTTFDMVMLRGVNTALFGGYTEQFFLEERFLFSVIIQYTRKSHNILKKDTQ